jgi:hypothetical protein
VELDWQGRQRFIQEDQDAVLHAWMQEAGGTIESFSVEDKLWYDALWTGERAGVQYCRLPIEARRRKGERYVWRYFERFGSVYINRNKPERDENFVFVVMDNSNETRYVYLSPPRRAKLLEQVGHYQRDGGGNLQLVVDVPTDWFKETQVKYPLTKAGASC